MLDKIYTAIESFINDNFVLILLTLTLVLFAQFYYHKIDQESKHLASVEANLRIGRLVQTGKAARQAKMDLRQRRQLLVENLLK